MKFIDFLGLKLPPIGDVLRGEVHSPPLSCVSCLHDQEKKPIGDYLRGDVHSPPLSCVSHPHEQEKKPIGDHPRGEVHSPPSMESRSSVSSLHDQGKNYEEESGEISLAKVAVAREFFPLTPERKGFLGTKDIGYPRQEIAPIQPKRKFTASLTLDETLNVEKKAKHNGKQKAKKVASECEEDEERRNGVSTELVLCFDPYKIKKKLTKSDLGYLARLLIPRACVTTYVLPCMSEETVTRVMSSKGADVIVWDADTHSQHRLMFAFWASTGAYVLKGCWIKEFVQRRGLAACDEIGIYWDPTANMFHFSLLRKAN
ncbi:hypothetical protein BT93_E1715 [Corymbia citriodora subsp. variegata]|nr:hypothetical protein BT93_E1715 [Corymbia citriodora subsp. variegata]